MSRTSDSYYRPRQKKALWFFLISGLLAVATSATVPVTEVEISEIPELVENPAEVAYPAAELLNPFAADRPTFLVSLQGKRDFPRLLRHYQSSIVVLFLEKQGDYLDFRPLPLTVLTFLYTSLPDPPEPKFALS
jgi:hypothetical protein